MVISDWYLIISVIFNQLHFFISFMVDVLLLDFVINLAAMFSVVCAFLIRFCQLLPRLELHSLCYLTLVH